MSSIGGEGAPGGIGVQISESVRADRNVMLVGRVKYCIKVRLKGATDFWYSLPGFDICLYPIHTIYSNLYSTYVLSKSLFTNISLSDPLVLNHLERGLGQG